MSLISLVVAKLSPLDSEAENDCLKTADFASGPFTPFSDIVPIDKFESDLLIDGIFKNLFMNNVEFDTVTWRGLTKLCQADFDGDLSDRIRLQLLFLVTKLDPEECIRNNDTYNLFVKEFVQELPVFTAELATEKRSVEAKSLLSKRLIKKALQLALNEVGLEFDIGTYENILSTMKLYAAVWETIGLRWMLRF